MSSDMKTTYITVFKQFHILWLLLCNSLYHFFQFMYCCGLLGINKYGSLFAPYHQKDILKESATNILIHTDIHVQNTTGTNEKFFKMNLCLKTTWEIRIPQKSCTPMLQLCSEYIKITLTLPKGGLNSGVKFSLLIHKIHSYQ